MELPFSADVLVPLGVGAAALILAVVIVAVRFVRNRRRSAVAVAGPVEPTHADWTGETVGQRAVAHEPAPEPVLQPVMAAEAPRRPATVAEMVAEREADTAPLPVQSDVLLARARAHRAAAERAAALQAEATRAAEEQAGGATPAEPARAEELAVSESLGGDPETGSRPAALSPADRGAAEVEAEVEADTADRTDAVAPTDERPSTAQLAALGAAGAAAAGAEPAEGTQVADPAGRDTAGAAPSPSPVPRERPAEEQGAAASEPQDAGAQADEHPAQELTAPQEPDAAPTPSGPIPEQDSGSGPRVAAAVQQALAARAARSAQVVDPRRGDARDRLLAVLLDDPVRAVGAAVDLQTQQEELVRLAEAMRSRRAELATVVQRLAEAGLAPGQVAKLAGLEPTEVEGMLGRSQPR